MLSGFVFFLSSCGALRKADDPYRSSSSTVKKTPSRSKKAPTRLSAIRKEVTDQAKLCKGSRYKYGGKNRRGFDCSGFTSYVMNKVDIDISGSSSSQARMGKKI
ncbi:MAG: NlpC/P60 family protein, partial [Bacteroidota bacterium]